jgi:hypothetical protein
MAQIYDECLSAAVAAEKITAATAKKLRKYIGDAEKEAESLGKGGTDAYTFATSKAAARMIEDVGRRKMDIANDILRTQRLMEDAPKNSAGIFRGLQAIIGERVRGEGGKFSLVQSQKEAKRFLASYLTDFIEDLRSTNFGMTRDVTAPRNTVSELMGRETGVAGAKVNATGWQKMMGTWRDMMEAEGVKIRELADYFLPQQFNTLKVKGMGRDGFVGAMTDRWQKGELRLRDFESSADDALLKPGVDDERVADILGGAYDNIATKGNISIEPGVTTKDTMADRYNKRRVFEWTSDKAYFDFTDTFGHGADNLGEAFMRHFHQMSLDLGTARILGGDPDTMAKTLIQYGQKSGISQGQQHVLEKLYYHSSGQAHAVANVTWANTAQAVRSWLSSVQLGGAMLSSQSDYAFIRSTAAFNGLSSTRVMGRYLENLGTLSSAEGRRAATQQGLMIETGTRGLRDHFDEVKDGNLGKPGSSLLTGEGLEAASAGMSRIAGQAAEFVMRATGLEHHSNAGRVALGNEFLATLADHAGKTLDAMPERLGAFLQRYGLDAADWDVLRTGAMHDENLFMDPMYLAHSGTAAQRDTALRLVGAIDAETKYAVPEGGVTTRAMLLGTTKPGSLVGEVLRSFQYKGFAGSVAIFNGWRAIDNIMGKQGYMPRGQYLAALAIEATVLGGLSYQLKNIAAGRDPEAMDTPEFWFKAAAMGGAGGMLGDQIKTALQTKSAQDAARGMTPTAGLIADIYSLSGGNINQGYSGEKMNFGRESANFLRKYALPRTFYTSLGVDRLGWDTLQRMWDPEAGGAFARIAQRSQKQTGTQYWWRPGQTEPTRPPNLEAALGRQ